MHLQHSKVVVVAGLRLMGPVLTLVAAGGASMR
jgi:hypothetical protein